MLPASAEIRNDVHIQTDSDAVRLDIDSRTYKEILSFFESGYPTASVILHAVSQGVSINDAVYLAVKANREKAGEIFSVATGLLPSLPGWVCHTSEWAAGRYPTEFSLDELGPQPSIKKVADLFFTDNKRMAPFPEWQVGQGHMDASVAELDSLPRQEWWYRAPQPGMTDEQKLRQPVFVSLYQDNKTILVDNTLGQIELAKSRGVGTLPVVFIYNEAYFYPISELGEDAKIADVAGRFFGSGKEATPVPDWEEGEYHLMAKREELEGIFDIPKKEDVDPQFWDRIAEDLRTHGFRQRPLLMSLVDTNRMWADDTTRIAVAKELGIEDVPVVFLFHGVHRQACGQSANDCVQQICDAAVAGGADASVCSLPPEPGAGTVPYSAPLPPPGGNASPS